MARKDTVALAISALAAAVAGACAITHSRARGTEPEPVTHADALDTDQRESATLPPSTASPPPR